MQALVHRVAQRGTIFDTRETGMQVISQLSVTASGRQLPGIEPMLIGHRNNKHWSSVRGGNTKGEFCDAFLLSTKSTFGQVE